MLRHFWAGLAVVSCCAPAFAPDFAMAQDTAPADTVLDEAGSNLAVPAIESADAVAAETLTIPALTPIIIEILSDLGSNTSQQGDRFPLRLAEPIVIDGRVVVPAGTAGEGEVIHAKKNGGMGSAGELILTARFLDVGGTQLRLRSMSFDGVATSRIDTAGRFGIAGAVVPAVSLVGFFIKGGKLAVVSGSLASAKTAESFDITPGDEEPALVSAADNGPEVPDQQGEME